jgi:peptidyl-prolyl cis-trans isomerase B (cyclophilin B)
MKKSAIILLSLIFVFLACGKAEKQAETPAMEEEKAAVEPETEAEAEVEEGMSVEGKMATKPPVWGSIKRSQNPVVVMETNHGTIELELFWKETPKTAENLLYLTNSGYYDNLTFHRIVPNFVIQGGDPLGNGTGGPGYTIPFEKANTKHLRGSLGMARSQDPNSGGSQFYICLRDLPNLDGNYVVFGKVVKGMDVVDKIAQVPTGTGDFPQKQVIMTKVYEKK